MHYHCEILMPPTDNVESAIEAVLEKFSESNEEASQPFWDWYQIGGRWSGHHITSKFDREKLAEFHEWLQAEKVTVSGVVAGKQELQPASQAKKVDKKWNEMFPSEKWVPCPLFSNAGPRFDDDICKLSEMAPALACHRFILAGPSFRNIPDEKDGKWDGPLKAAYMLSDEVWNGVIHMKVQWDGKVSSAIKEAAEHFKNYNPEYTAIITPSPDWLIVTVDYHS